MDTAIALTILVGLGVALLLVRRSLKRRKRLIEDRERARRRQPKYKPHPMSSRTEMRAYDDPSTLAGEITTRGSPTTTQNPLGGVATSVRVTDRPGLRTRSEARHDALGATGKGSRADGKSGA